MHVFRADHLGLKKLQETWKRTDSQPQQSWIVCPSISRSGALGKLPYLYLLVDWCKYAGIGYVIIFFLS